MKDHPAADILDEPRRGPSTDAFRRNRMTTRRAFLRRWIGFGLAIGAEANASARVRSTKAVRFTALVRARTKTLRIVPGRWRWIVAHHSAIRYGNAATYAKAHRGRGMENGLAYHFVIGNGVDSGDGEIEIGPRWLRQIEGGHVRDETINRTGIGICLVGNFDETGPTRNQIAAFRELVDYLRTEVVGKRVRFAVHREIDPGHTACPGRHFPTELMHRLFR